MVQDGRMCGIRAKFSGAWSFKKLVRKKTNFGPLGNIENMHCL